MLPSAEIILGEIVKDMKERAPRNRTLTCTNEEIEMFSKQLQILKTEVTVERILNKIINQDFFDAVSFVPNECVDLLIMDPPYNLLKNYNGYVFKSKKKEGYSDWFEYVIVNLKPVLKPTASLYICSDWQTSNIVFPVLEKHFLVRNRITWEREKGRGAKNNWKNNTEDIWFCSVSEDILFNVNAVKLKRRVLAPYKNSKGQPKDWSKDVNGNFRLTYPSNLWSDLTIPFWSMPENTDHPTQKPEKLIAKIILASSNQNDIVFDPFLGSGTTAVVAKKLKRNFLGIEISEEYCCWALKRLSLAERNPTIQGYSEGFFWERNSLNEQNVKKPSIEFETTNVLDLFNE